MTDLDLDAIRVNAEWAAGASHHTSVAHRVLSTDIPALIAEVEDLRELLAIKRRSNARLGDRYVEAERDRQRAIAEVEALRGRIAAVGELHSGHNVLITYNRSVLVCYECGDECPCATVLALHASTPTTGEPDA